MKRLYPSLTDPVQRLRHLVTYFDRKEEGKRGYNHYALGHYLARVDDIEADLARGVSLHRAMYDNFQGTLL